MKGSSTVTGGAYEIDDDPIHQDGLYQEGDIVIKKTFETSTRSLLVKNGTSTN